MAIFHILAIEHDPAASGFQPAGLSTKLKWWFLSRRPLAQEPTNFAGIRAQAHTIDQGAPAQAEGPRLRREASSRQGGGSRRQVSWRSWPNTC